MLGLLKQKPWKNLIATLTLPVPARLFKVFILYSVLLPCLVVVHYTSDWVDALHVKHFLSIFALFVLFFIPRYSRTGKNLLSLQTNRRKGLFPIVYHSVLRVGGAFAVIFFTYLTLLIVLFFLKITTGISSSQEIPDLTHMTLPSIIYGSFTAGLVEEVWRAVSLILILIALKNITGKYWNNNIVKMISLVMAVLATSFTFGWLHTFGYSDSYFSVPIIIQIGVVGTILSCVYLLTRRIWYAIFIHFVIDLVSMSAHANNLTSAEALTIFIEEKKTLLINLGYVSLFCFFCFLLSIYFLRFSKGANRKMTYY